jgi:adenine/guanine phosphoribosyltransferase-like PRPP-binding protein
VALKVSLEFMEIRQRLQQCPLPDVDIVVGIGSGGVTPAALVAYQLGRPLTILPINYRDADNTPRYDEPQQLADIAVPADVRSVLLVDDVSVSGKTLSMAREILASYEVTTFVLKGRADIVLFPSISECVQWPWKGIA